MSMFAQSQLHWVYMRSCRTRNDVLRSVHAACSAQDMVSALRLSVEFGSVCLALAEPECFLDYDSFHPYMQQEHAFVKSLVALPGVRIDNVSIIMPRARITNTDPAQQAVVKFLLSSKDCVTLACSCAKVVLRADAAASHVRKLLAILPDVCMHWALSFKRADEIVFGLHITEFMTAFGVYGNTNKYNAMAFAALSRDSEILEMQRLGQLLKVEMLETAFGLLFREFDMHEISIHGVGEAAFSIDAQDVVSFRE